jgi:hypothetical protein
MTYLLHVFLDDDHYEVTTNGKMIFSVVKYVGESEFRREINFEDLAQYVKERIITEVAGGDFNSDVDSD